MNILESTERYMSGVYGNRAKKTAISYGLGVKKWIEYITVEEKLCLDSVIESIFP